MRENLLFLMLYIKFISIANEVQFIDMITHRYLKILVMKIVNFES